MDEASVRVALRVRPLNTKEQLQNCSECIGFVPGQAQVVLGSARAYAFDFVFQPNSSQVEIFQQAAHPLIEKFFEGYNTTVLAYGQTGSGKTYTMGTGLDADRDVQDDTQGIVPRAINEIFSFIGALTDKYGDEYKCELFVSFLELYNEELVDLLNPQARLNARRGTALTIREDAQGGIYWSGVKEERVASQDELFGCLQKGSLCRTTGSTDMNLTSSRSHAIFSIIMKQEIPQSSEGPAASGVVEVRHLQSKFHFVDLAGSERMKKTKAVGERAKEGIAINSGLLAMGKVIHALNENASHVPYRDSKLTRLLQDSLGGNSQTLMIACVSSSDSNFGETLNTLSYASRARNIKNKVMVNQDYQTMEVHQLRAEISRLKMELMNVRNNGTGTLTRPGSSESIDSLQTASLKRALRENEAIRLEFKQLEMTVFQMQQRNNELVEANNVLEAERDTLLMSQSPESTVVTADGVSVHPVIGNYIRTISDLKRKLDVAESKSSSSVPARPFSSASISRRSNETLDILGRPQNGGFTQSKAAFEYNPRVADVIEKAKQDIRQELKILQSRKSLRSRATTPLNRSQSSKFGNDADFNDDRNSSGSDTNDDEIANSRAESPLAMGTAAEDEVLDMLDKIQSDITIKEELVTQLEKTQADYQAMKEKYEEKMKQLHENLAAVQRERDSALKKSDGSDDKEKMVQIRQKYEEKVKKLSTEISEFKRKFQEQQQELNAKKINNEKLIVNMKQHLENLKQEKLKLLKRLKDKENQAREKDTIKDQEISKLKRKQSQLTELTKKLERSNQMQRVLLKRRTEEHVQAQSKLKSVMQMLKKTRPVSSPISKNRLVGGETKRAAVFVQHNPRESPTRLSNTSRKQFHEKPRRPFGPSQESLTHREEERLRMQANFKKNLLYHAINNYVTSKQVNEVAEGLIRKRESLSQEKQELLAEIRMYDENIENAEVGNPSDTFAQENIEQLKQQRQEIDSRIEIINAEVKYLSSRIQSIQVEAAQSQGAELASLNGSISNMKISVPDMNTSYENAVELLKSLDEDELRQLVELMTEDLVTLKLVERTKQLELQELEKESQDLRDALQRTRKAAIEATLENQRKILEYETKFKVGSPLPLREEPTKERETFSILKDVKELEGDLTCIKNALAEDETEVDLEPPQPRQLRGRSATDSAIKRPTVETADLSIPTIEMHLPHTMSANSISSSQSFPSLNALNVPPSLPPQMPSTASSKPSTPSIFNQALFSAKERERDRNLNVFERLHREQTISSQAKMREAALQHMATADGVSGQTTPLVTSEIDQSIAEKLLIFRNQLQRDISAPHMRSTDSTDPAGAPNFINGLDVTDEIIYENEGL